MWRVPVVHQECVDLLLGVLALSDAGMGDLDNGAHELLRLTIGLWVLWGAQVCLEPAHLGILPPVVTVVRRSPIMDHGVWVAKLFPALVQCWEQLLKLGALGHGHLWPLAVGVNEDVEIVSPGATYGSLIVCTADLPWSAWWCPDGDGCWIPSCPSCASPTALPSRALGISTLVPLTSTPSS